MSDNTIQAQKAKELDRLIDQLTGMGFDKDEPINGGDCVEAIDEIYQRLIKQFRR